MGPGWPPHPPSEERRPGFLLGVIHRSAWKGYSANFALTAFRKARKGARYLENGQDRCSWRVDRIPVHCYSECKCSAMGSVQGGAAEDGQPAQPWGGWDRPRPGAPIGALRMHLPDPL